MPCSASAASDAAADQRVDLLLVQQTGERAVADAVGADDLRGDDLAVLYGVNLELLRAAKVLKDLSVFIGHCDFHISQTSVMCTA